MRRNFGWILSVAALVMLAACASYVAPTREETAAVVKSSFSERGSAKLDRLEQSPMQALCSAAALAHTELSKADSERVEKQASDSVKYPADGKYLGDWKNGERIAQSGVGMQFSDGPNTVNGGNCYACHQLTTAEISYGNIGPPLLGYGKLRGNGEAITKYTWAKLWNSHASNACSQMPRYGDAGILSETQLKDVMALLMDPQSPVNK